MKMIEKYLYIRSGYYYFRLSIPRHLHAILYRKEIVVALGSREEAESRVLVAKLQYDTQNAIRRFERAMKQTQHATEAEKHLQALESAITEIKESVGYNRTAHKHLTTTARNMHYSQLVKLYLDASQHEAPSTRYHKIKTYNLFEELIGDLALRTISTDHARAYKDALLLIPANAKKKLGITNFKGVDLKTIQHCGQPQQPKTINNCLTYMGILFKWAQREKYYLYDNPFEGLRIAGEKNTAKARTPFTSSELQRLFQGKEIGTAGRKMRGDETLFWIPLIALYTGMRMNEICQLLIEDVQSKGDMYVFDVNDHGDKRLKNSASRRIIPIHNTLIRAGFIDYWHHKKEQGEARLFPSLRKGKTGSYSSNYTKKFWRFLHELELKREGLCFHSLRHTFIDGMREAGIERPITMALSGHKSSSTHDSYGHGYALSTLHTSLNKLSFPIKIE